MSAIDVAKFHPSYQPHFQHFPSRRSTVFSAKGAVATSQPLPCQAGVEILKKGGNAADAAVATAAAMNVCEPCSTGIGGDIFCLFWDAKSKTVKGINGSGRSPKALTLEHLRKQGITGSKVDSAHQPPPPLPPRADLCKRSQIPPTNLNSVTVPCAAAGWLMTIKEFGSGKLSMREILDPAIRMARDGVPAHEFTSRGYQSSEQLIKNASPGWRMMMMPDGTPPQPSHVMKHPELADTFEAVADLGHDGYYKGRIAEAIVDLVKSGGGVMTLDDLAECDAQVIEPIKYEYRAGSSGKEDGVTLWECPPNGQGLTALVALGIVEAYEKQHGVDMLNNEHNSVEYLHVLIEALRLAFAAQYFVTDPDVEPVPTQELLDKAYLARRAALIDPKKAIAVKHGDPVNSSDTIYLSAADKDGNACSFIASNYAGFGTGAIPEGCGFTLQNRGMGFNLEEGHPNCVKGGKRPYHTIIPGMATHNGELLMSFGVMGGFMQPQGHVQVLLNKLRGFSSQSALDAPRFCISAGLPDVSKKEETASAGDMNSEIWLEEGISDEVLSELSKMGHAVKRATGYQRITMGRGQVIQAVRDPSGNNVWSCGSDLRGDGCAMGEI